MNGLAGQHIVVTGPGGFIGQALCSAALAQGAHVTGIGPGPVPNGVEHHPGRIEGEAALIPVLRNADILIHAAGRGTPGAVRALSDPAAQNEWLMTAVLLEAAAHAGVGRIVLVSSGGTVYGVPRGPDPIDETHPTHPTSRYGAVKLQAEQMGLAMDRMGHVNCVVARLSNPYGPGQVNRRGQGLIATVAARAQAGEAIEIWGDGSTVRDYLYIDDAAEGLLAAGRLPGGTVVNVSAGHGLSTRHVVTDVLDRLGLAATVRYLPDRDAGVPCNVLSHARLRAHTGWQPRIAWSDGLARTAAWWRGAALPEPVPGPALASLTPPL